MPNSTANSTATYSFQGWDKRKAAWGVCVPCSLTTFTSQASPCSCCWSGRIVREMRGKNQGNESVQGKNETNDGSRRRVDYGFGSSVSIYLNYYLPTYLPTYLPYCILSTTTTTRCIYIAGVVVEGSSFRVTTSFYRQTSRRTYGQRTFAGAPLVYSGLPNRQGEEELVGERKIGSRIRQLQL
ncbi:hypothetical protein BKA81DRAFT_208459 [Phyllosticta paracitricarpa]